MNEKLIKKEIRSLKSNNARDYISYSTLKTIRFEFRHFHLFLFQ